MKIIGLDLSLTSTGIALPDGSTSTLRPKAITGMARLHYLRQQILDAVDQVDLAIIEGYSMGTARQASHAHALGELGGVIRLALYSAGARYVDVPPASLKKFATGKGNANKELMLVSAVKRLGYEGSDNNEADALWLRAMGMHALGAPVVELPQTHLDGVAKIAWPELVAS